MPHRFTVFCSICLAALAVMLTVRASWAEEVAPKLPRDMMFFESNVRPLLIDNCLTCHSDKKQKGGLRLDSMAAILKGGKHGPAIVRGKPEDSRLISAVSYKDLDLQMPPEDHLSGDQVLALSTWVKMGAPWPAGQPAIHAPPKSKHRIITDKDKTFWSFQPVKDPPIPAVRDQAWSRNPVDRFILAKLEAEGLEPASEASREELIRRATFDLIGLPPTPAEVEAFVNDPAADAYEHLVDRLLASPRYGERWGRHWLDLVRYAESDGFNQDAYRVNAWPYRDYVIRSFNEDKPYDQFVTEQLAGDEIAPNDPQVMVATGYLRGGLYEFNQRDVHKQWDQMLTDITDVSADAFLGLSMGCCRCHDHKFDPILHTDYYRFQAFFAGMLPRNDVILASADEQAAHALAIKTWEEKTADIRAQIDAIEKPLIDKSIADFISKFPPATQIILAKTAEQRTPYEEQIAQLALRQVNDPTSNKIKIPSKEKAKHTALTKQLAEFEKSRPKPLLHGLCMGDVGPVGPNPCIPGDTAHPLEPGFPVVLDGLPITKPPIAPTAKTSGRRLALAKWIVQPENPLTPRVIVNRIWQYHFGRGIVATSGDFGHLGTHPSHPELLDFLAKRFVEGTNGSSQGIAWHMKPMHRMMMLSATYRQSALRTPPELAKLKDPDNLWLWRMNTLRLDAEQVHDAMLALSGELHLNLGGPSVEHTEPVRAIYLKQIRNKPDPLLQVFDAPEAFGSVCVRNQTTTATQALLMINGEWTLKRSDAFAKRARKEAKSNDPAALVDAVYRLAYGRPAHSDETEAAVRFLTRDKNVEINFVDFCHVVLNSSEFLYVD